MGQFEGAKWPLLTEEQLADPAERTRAWFGSVHCSERDARGRKVERVRRKGPKIGGALHNDFLR